ncbi:MAG TPA: hypothetical protein VGJ60_20465 [Chloroflexota bacterium]|jgi:hypothetical protein
MPNNRTSTDRFRSEAQKYQGKIGVMEGKIQLQQWHRPYLKNQHEAYQQQGVDLRPEREVKGKSVPAPVKKYDSDRNKGGG